MYFRTTYDTIVRPIQFKLAHQKAITNTLLFKMNLVAYDHWLENETIMHAFIEYSHVNNLLGQVELWFRKHIDKYDKLSDAEKIVGVNVQKATINAIIMVTKEVT